MAKQEGRHRSRVSDVGRDIPSDYNQATGSTPRHSYEGGQHNAKFEGSARALDDHPQDALSPDVLRSRDNSQRPPAPSRSPWFAAAGLAILIGAANVLAMTGFRLQYVGPALGFWFVLALPAYLLYTTTTWRGSSGAERAGYCVAAVVLLLIVGGLTINTILPPLGIARPLDPVPVVVFGDVLNASLYVFRLRRKEEFPWRTYIRALKPSEARLIVSGLVCVLLAVLGANRLNNDAGDQVALAALGCIILTILALLGRQRQLSDSVMSGTLYFVSLAILLMSSLRGWYVTGNDIQSEYRVFQLTEAHGRWSMTAFHSAYNACLSITILPTEIARAANIDSPYVFRLFFQFLFALCPVLAYTFWRRYAPKLVALVAVIYFIGFPTYLYDMPGANRQEIAFLFVSAAALALTNSRWPRAWRRLALFAAGVGVELSHYSTMYMFIATLVVAWVLGSLVRLPGRRNSSRIASSEQAASWARGRPTIGIGSVLAAISVLLLWGGLATQTAGPLVTDVRDAVSEFGHPTAVTPYSLFSRATVSTQRLLDNYRSGALRQNTATRGSEYFSAATVARYPTPLDNEPVMPLTSIGRLLSRVGIPVETLNTDVRQGAAKDEQLFIAVGLAAFVFSRRLRGRTSREVVCIAAASIFMVALFTVFPNFSVDYSASRAFQQALIWAAPVLVVGSIAIFRLFGRRTSVRIAACVSMAIFISTSGFLPQAVGGYAAELNLNNSGQYYDYHYMQPQEVAAVTWLEGKPGVLPAGLQAPIGSTTSDPFAFNDLANVTGMQSVGDIYPALVKRSSWVILTYTILRTGRAPLYTDGELVTYRYPTAFLQENKNLVYDNGGAEIYK